MGVDIGMDLSSWKKIELSKNKVPSFFVIISRLVEAIADIFYDYY